MAGEQTRSSQHRCQRPIIKSARRPKVSTGLWKLNTLADVGHQREGPPLPSRRTRVHDEQKGAHQQREITENLTKAAWHQATLDAAAWEKNFTSHRAATLLMLNTAELDSEAAWGGASPRTPSGCRHASMCHHVPRRDATGTKGPFCSTCLCHSHKASWQEVLSFPRPPPAHTSSESKDSHAVGEF